MLTPEQVARLNEQFEVKEHEFYGDYAYVDEVAVTQRLDEVDPSWSFERLRVYREGNNAIAEVRLTVSGVSRDGIGMADLTLTKKTGDEMSVTEPEKKAITDALRRAARLFGIGRYLLLLPKGANSYDRLATELRKMRQSAPQPPQSPPPATEPPATAQNGATGQPEGNKEQWKWFGLTEPQWVLVLHSGGWQPLRLVASNLLVQKGWYNHATHANNSIGKLFKDKAIRDDMTVGEALKVIYEHVKAEGRVYPQSAA